MNTELTEEQQSEMIDWIKKLTRKQRRIVFKHDKYSDRVKQALLK